MGRNVRREAVLLNHSALMNICKFKSNETRREKKTGRHDVELSSFFSFLCSFQSFCLSLSTHTRTTLMPSHHSFLVISSFPVFFFVSWVELKLAVAPTVA